MAYAKTNMDTASVFWDEKLCPTISLIHSSSKKLEIYGKKVREKERQLKDKHKGMWKSKYESEVGYISEEIRTLIKIFHSLNEEDEEKDREASFQRNRHTISPNFIKRPYMQEDDENVKTIKLLKERVESLQSQLKNEQQEQKDRRKSFEAQFKTNEPEESFERRKRSNQSDPPSFDEQLQNFQTNEPKEDFYRRNPSYQSDPPSKRFNRHEYEEKVRTLEEIVRTLNADNQDLQSRSKKKITQLEEEKLDLQTNLSAVIGRRIKDGNPDIADLSDENRPTKLAEMFSELYDNEWTDCLEENIETTSEEYGREKELLKILMDIFNVCFEWSTEKYFFNVQRAIDRTYLDGRHCSGEKEEVVLPNNLQQPIKEFKKKRALQVLPTIHKLVMNRLPEYSHDRFATTVYQAYIQQCIKFSWLAVVQDPPMALNAEGGTEFNKKQFKEYMRRGEYMEFVVWPSLHLTSGGNLLAKGVAQGTNSKAKLR